MNGEVPSSRSAALLWPAIAAVLLVCTPLLFMHARTKWTDLELLKKRAIDQRMHIINANSDITQMDSLLERIILISPKDQTAQGIVTKLDLNIAEAGLPVSPDARPDQSNGTQLTPR